MDKQDEYRRNAEYAQQMAESSGMAEDRASWLRVATGWLSLLPRKKAGNGHEASQNKPREHFDEHVRAMGTRQKHSGASH